MFVFPDHLQDYVGKEEDFSDQQLCGQERNSSLDREEPEALQIKEEQQEPEHPWTKEETMELLIIQHEEQLVLKQETEDRMEEPFQGLTFGEIFPEKEHFMDHTSTHSGEKINQCLSC